MKLLKKTLAATTLIAVFVFSTFTTMPSITAHTPSWNIPTYAYLVASPDTVGVGQYTLLIMWLNTVVPTAGGTGGDAWRNFRINVTAPDGRVTTLGPFTSGAVGTTFTTFTPTQTGKYTMVFYWPGQVLTNGTGEPNFRGLAYVNDFFQPSQSTPITLTVTANPLPSWQEPPLPTDYWTRPINAANREWSQLASNWLGGAWLVGKFQRAGQAPNTPHIIWQKQITAGGIADAQWPGIPYNYDDYESPWSTPIIMNGRIYYNTPATATSEKYGYGCIDLYTGKQVWFKNGTDNGLNNPVALVGYASGLNTAPALSQTFPSLSMSQIYHYYSVNGQGTGAYLWLTQGSTWYMLDPDTGNWIMSLKNVPGGTAVVDQDGSLLRYSYNTNTGVLLCWNSSQSIPPAGPSGTSQQQWKPRTGATVDAVNDSSWTVIGPVINQWDAIDILPRSGYTMNVTIDKGLPVAPPSLTGGLPSPGAGSMLVIQDEARVPKYVFGFRNLDAVASTTGGSGIFNVWCVKINEHAAPYSPYPDKTFTQNTNLGYTATLMYNKRYTNLIPGNLTYNLGPVDYSTGIFTIFAKETMQWWGFSLTTGDQVWGPTQPEVAWDMYGDDSAVAYGNMYTCGYGGVLYCYDMASGKLEWTYTASNIGYESPYGNYPLNIAAVSDGKVFLYSTEHSPTKPLWRGSFVRAVDAQTGTEVWKIQDFNMGLAVCDGYLVSGNSYNNMIECYGKGPSATTVVASPKVQGKGSPILIEGTVTDESPGAPGTPAIADVSMQQWMEYLYMQQAKPTNATGVQVVLEAKDPNGNTQSIGTVTSDINGNFAVSWTPPVEGLYTVMASFAGSASYGASSAETHFVVGPAAQAQPVTPPPPPTSAPPATPTPPTTQPPTTPTQSPSPVTPPSQGAGTEIYVAAAAAVVIVVVAVVAVAVFRRRK
ncbi:MAG: PQQ-binding-like beta-propeller repeat protein [Candidatus Bathyarchaeia archaeon]